MRPPTSHSSKTQDKKAQTVELGGHASRLAVDGDRHRLGGGRWHELWLEDGRIGKRRREKGFGGRRRRGAMAAHDGRQFLGDAARPWGDGSCQNVMHDELGELEGAIRGWLREKAWKNDEQETIQFSNQH